MTEEKKKLNVLQLTAVSFASVASMCIGSIFGLKGTYIGTGAGTMISGILAFIFEKFSLRAHDNIRKQNWFFHSDDEDATSMFPAIRVKRSQRPWMLTALAMGMALVSAGIAFGVLGIVKATAGTTLGDYSTPRRTQTAPAVTVTPTVTSSPEDTFTPSESFSESSSPSPVPTDTITVTATPSVSPDSSPPSISPSPTVSTSDPQQ